MNRRKVSEIVRGVEWYQYFVSKDNQIGLIDEVPNYLQKFLVSGRFPRGDKHVPFFAAFDSYLDFIAHIQYVPKERWNFFEYIMSERPQKLYFDIDIKKSYIQTNETIDEFSQRLIEAVIENIIEVFDDVLGLPFDITKNLLLFTSHRHCVENSLPAQSEKRSFHIIIDGYYVLDHKTNAKIAFEVINGIDSPELITVQSGELAGKKIIDYGVYKSKQQLRLYKSQKPETVPRPKEFLSVFNYKGVTYSHDLSELDGITDFALRERRMFTYIFGKSCVTNTVGCTPIVYDEQPSNTPVILKTGISSADDDLPRHIMEKAIPIIKTKIDLLNWTIGDIEGNTIHLKRKRPSMCGICKRIHEHQNSLVTVNPKSGVIRFRCWNSEGGESIVLGEIDTGHETSIREDHANVLMKRLQKRVPAPSIPILNCPPILSKGFHPSEFLHTTTLRS